MARVELGAENYGFSANYNGHPATAAAIRLAPGANALKTIGEVKAKIAEIAKQFPADVKVIYPWDTTPFVKVSLKQVVETLFEAMILVFLVMFLFLQNWRATLIPTIAIPVVLLGTLAVMAVAGFSINTLTLFGMVLAIGLLVDDAIVVVENVERLIQEDGCPPKEAAQAVDGRDFRRADRDRRGARRGVPADGVLRRLDRRHLSPVLADHGLGDGAVGAGRVDPDAGAGGDDPHARRSAEA